jgi:hypothetical protein
VCYACGDLVDPEVSFQVADLGMKGQFKGECHVRVANVVDDYFGRTRDRYFGRERRPMMRVAGLVVRGISGMFHRENGHVAWNLDCYRSLCRSNCRSRGDGK